MADRRKATRSYTEANFEVSLHEELPPVSRKNGYKKRGETGHTQRPRDNTHNNPQANRETPSLSSKSKTTRLFGGIFSTPHQEDQ